MQTEYRIRGYVVGPIWWPVGEDCYKHLDYKFTRHKKQPFRDQHETLRDALLAITNDRDFQSCELADGFLTIKQHRGNRRIERDFPLDMFPSIADMRRDDWCGPEYGED